MKLSTRARYGVRFMTALACANGDELVFLKDIAASEEISEKYLSLIVIPLRTAGLIKSRRGAHGGYYLTNKPEEISLRSIVEALEGEISLVDCVKKPSGCQRSPICPARDIWSALGSKISETLNNIPLSQLAQTRINKIKHE